MKVLVAETCGLCNGAKRTLDGVLKSYKQNKNVTLYKEILHNKNVINSLKQMGIKQKDNLEDINKDDYVIIRGHGEPISTFKFLESNNIEYLDCTCPNVKYINLLVKEKSEEGYKIIIVGKKSHPEVIATSGWCDNPILVEEEGDINNINFNFSKYYLVVQTTFSTKKAEQIIDKIKCLMKNGYKEFLYKNTTCNAQKIINQSSEKLANKVDAMIVIGGKNSSNTKELYNNLSKVKKTFLIEDVCEVNELIREKEITSNMTIGITAGASTLKEDILSLENLLKTL